MAATSQGLMPTAASRAGDVHWEKQAVNAQSFVSIQAGSMQKKNRRLMGLRRRLK